MGEPNSSSFILGLDLGANSVGWALFRAQQGGDGRLNPVAIEQAGVRVFEAGVEGDIEKGKDVSRAIDRRTARLARRRLDRLARRLNALYAILRRAGLLPPIAEPTPPPPPPNRKRTARERRELRIAIAQRRDKSLAELDKALVSKWQARLRSGGAPEEKVRLVPHVLPYLLRARALDEPLTPHELGRALFHLGQRRGFLSNRKSTPKKDEDLGEVKSHIHELEEKMAGQTLGQYFAALDPHEERIRHRWTSRQMYNDEFEKIWSAQQPHHAALLADELKKSTYRAIFHQRPLRIRKEFLGNCECERDRKRAPIALLAAQRFRMLQMVNHTRILWNGLERPLTTEERAKMIEALESQGDLEFGKAKKLLKLGRSEKFNFEEGGEKRFLGNRTAAKLRGIFGERWDSLLPKQRDDIVNDWLSVQKDWVLAKRGMAAWGLDKEAAAELGALQLEDGHCRLSRQALAKLLPLMEAGEPYTTARLKVYGEQYAAKPVDELPAVAKAVPELRNPAVSRALTELRKVVNAIVRRWGKPAAIRIELARDLRNSRDKRQQIWKKNRENEKAREEAARKVLAERGNPNPSPEDIKNVSRADVQKVLLAEECKWICPYTSHGISMAALLGPQFEIEHIIPLSRSLDDSFMNKTLCEAGENRERKRNHTPWEAYHADPKWDTIISNVKRFRGSAARVKLGRFLMDDEAMKKFLAENSSNQLNDTRYATKLAKEYLGMLYGDEAASRVQASRGGVTAFLRNEWKLNSILGDGGEKVREDHRHHAVDAVAIGLTDPATVKMLSDAAARAVREGRRRFAPIQPPFDGFLDAVRASIAQIIVSHRVARKVSGPLHDETLYSKMKKDEEGSPCVHMRKRIEDLNKPDQVEAIVDRVVRERVRAKLQELGGDFKKFADPGNHPYMETRDGRRIPIHKVRIRDRRSTVPIGEHARERSVWLRNNHHVEIVEVKDKKGHTKWEGKMVTLFEAKRRLNGREPIVRRDHGEGKQFLFSLGHEETVRLTLDGGVGFYKVTKFSESANERIEIAFRRNRDARLAKNLPKGKEGLLRMPPDSLRKAELSKLTVDPLGELRRAND